MTSQRHPGYIPEFRLLKSSHSHPGANPLATNYRIVVIIPTVDLQKLFIVGKGSRQLKKAWLEAYALTGMWREACRRVGISHGSPTWWIKSDPKFVEALERVREVQGTVLKDEIWDRAVNGTDKPVMYKGQITGYYKEKSDELLKFEAKARMPEYRDGTQINLLTQGPQSITFVSGRERPELMCTQPSGKPPLLVDSTSTDKKSTPSK